VNWIDVNGVALRYELSGSGPRLLVLIHEMGGSLESWDLVLPYLTERRRVLRYDVRGAGLSEKIRGTLAIDDAVDDLGALLDALDSAVPAAVAGCAVGAAIAIRAASRFGERVAGLIAMAPATGIPPERRADTLAFADRLEREGVRASVGGRAPRSYPEELRQDTERYLQFRARQLSCDPESYAATYRMLVHLEMEEDFARIRCPTLVVAGTLDQSRPPSTVEPVARAIANARFEILRTGHFMAVQTPDLVAPLIADFLAGLDL
jgi:pimeloyl-ACP methyl ester carboxylesterase